MTTTPPPSDWDYRTTTPPPPPRPAAQESSRYAQSNRRAFLDLELPQLNSFPNLPASSNPNNNNFSHIIETSAGNSRNDRHDRHQRELEPLSRRLLPRPCAGHSNDNSETRRRDQHNHARWYDLQLPPLDDSEEEYFWEQARETDWMFRYDENHAYENDPEHVISLRQRPSSPLAVSQLNASDAEYSDYNGSGMAMYVAPTTPPRQQVVHHRSSTRLSSNLNHERHDAQDWSARHPRTAMEPLSSHQPPLIPIFVSQDRPTRVNAPASQQLTSGNTTFCPLSLIETAGIASAHETDAEVNAELHVQYSQSSSNKGRSSGGSEEENEEDDEDISYDGSRESTPTCCHSDPCDFHSQSISSENASNHNLARSRSGSYCATRYFVRESSVRSTGSIDLKMMGSASCTCCPPQLRRAVSAPAMFIVDSLEDCYQ